MAAQPFGQRAEIMNTASDQVMNPVVCFQHAINRQQGGSDEFGALFFPQAWPDNHVDRAGFILECQENGAACRGRPLSHGDEAAGPDVAAMRPGL